jgi:dipeptidyl aminopeptidase/acylaminoacyl peptidase
VQKVGGDLEEAIQITEATERDIGDYAWASQKRLVYLQDDGGDENFKLWAVDADGKNKLGLTNFPGVRTHIVDKLKDDEAHVIIALNNRDARVFDPHRLNIETGKITLLAQTPGNITDWLTDHQGKLRLAYVNDGVRVEIQYRENESQEFSKILETDFRRAFIPHLFSFDDQHLIVASNFGRDKKAFYSFDPRTQKLGKPLFSNSSVDVQSVLVSDRFKKITGFTYTTDKLHYHFIDEDRKNLQMDLENRLPGYVVSLVDASLSERQILVKADSDRTRGAYYFLDRDTGQFYKLADVSPWLPEDHMSAMKPISYRSRDGLRIGGYLTLPKGKRKKIFRSWSIPTAALGCATLGGLMPKSNSWPTAVMPFCK